MDAALAERTAVIFAIVSGGVIYSRKFYGTILDLGANAASPLLFPETVYNAPGSHLCALLGITGMSYTLVGDASVGISALKMAEQLLDAGEVDQCVVVGGEEVDWVLCEAYRHLRLTKKQASSARGMILAEGGAALVLKREGPLALEQIHDGVPFFARNEAGAAITQAIDAVVAGADLIVGSANGTFIDALEAEAIAQVNLPTVYPKQTLGEALGASALIQTIYAALALEKESLNAVAVSCLGLNQQASALRIGRAG
jgi:3-oxoacyl-(acyl-carrier-protein) synthase